MNDLPLILEAVLRGYRLKLSSEHGVLHWARVLENGMRVAEHNGADPELVALFAVLHDARRVNESVDHGHGRRAAEFARSLRDSHLHLDDERFQLLYDACRLHTNGLTAGDPTLQACWDADRLDLARVGIIPDPKRLCTEAARGLVEWATARALARHEPVEILNAWGL